MKCIQNIISLLLKLVISIFLLAVESLGRPQETTVHSQGSLVMLHSQQEPYLEAHLATGPSVKTVPQPVPCLLPVSLLLLLV